MTNTDFDLIADILKNMPDHSITLRTQKRSCVLSFADRFQKEFFGFNREFFMKACDEPSDEES